MEGGTRLATGIAVGYLMGRTKKMRLALMITAAGLTGGVAKAPGDLARRVVTGLGATGPVEELMDSVRGELKTAVATAATTMATRRIDALTGRLAAVPGSGDLGEANGSSGEDEDEDAGEEAGTDEGRENGGVAKRRKPRRGEEKKTGREDAGADEEEEDEDETQAASESEGEPESESQDEPEDESEGESDGESQDEPEPYKPVTRRRRSDSADSRAAAKEPRGETGSRGEGARGTRRPARAASGSGQTAERRTRR